MIRTAISIAIFLLIFGVSSANDLLINKPILSLENVLDRTLSEFTHTVIDIDKYEVTDFAYDFIDRVWTIGIEAVSKSHNIKFYTAKVKDQLPIDVEITIDDN